MRPEIGLDGDALRANVAAFAALGAPVAAVVKNDGYGWGARRLARELDAVVESYVVADEDELADLRVATERPIRLLADVPPARLPRVLGLGGIPNLSRRETLAAAAALAAERGPFTVRVGILDATGWSAIRADDAAAFATALAGTGLAVELWTHVTSTARAAAILEAFVAARAVFAAAGVAVVSTDVASTATASRATAADRLRIGVGLFGGRLGNEAIPASCALRVRAPVVRVHPPGEAGWAGYGDVPVPAGAAVAVLRCGYGDGFPKGLTNSADIVAVGMQYTSRLVNRSGPASVLIAERDSVDMLAAQAGITPHELVVGLAQR
jgi:alanine racemase